MAHDLTIGRTESGKSAFNKQRFSELRLKGAEVLAFNPTQETGYSIKDAYGCVAAEWEHHDPETFVNEVVRRIEKESKVRHLILDEAHLLPIEYSWLVTRGRHFGLNCHLISQRGASMNPAYRTQVATWYVFKCAGIDMKMVQDETGVKIGEHNLQQGEYLKIDIKGVEKNKVF